MLRTFTSLGVSCLLLFRTISSSLADDASRDFLGTGTGNGDRRDKASSQNARDLVSGSGRHLKPRNKRQDRKKKHLTVAENAHKDKKALRKHHKKEKNAGQHHRTRGGKANKGDTTREVTHSPTPSHHQGAKSHKADTSTGTSVGMTRSGLLTKWSIAREAVITAGSCAYAEDVATAGSGGWPTPRWLHPYTWNGFFCAVSQDLWNGGAACGQCFLVEYKDEEGSKGTDPGRAGSHVVQVAGDGAGESNHFDCFGEAFGTITGSTTGRFPISYTHVDCEGTAGDPLAHPTAVIMDIAAKFADRNYVKVLLAGGKTGILSANLYINNGGNDVKYEMERVVGATFKADFALGSFGRTTFEVLYDDGNLRYIDTNCFNGNWANAQKSSTCVGSYY